MSNKVPTLDVVVGGQYGSEAKGHTTEAIFRRRVKEFPESTINVIRVAGPNAGHTGHDDTKRSWALRQVPVAVVAPGKARLVIAPGSEIDPDVLVKELTDLAEAGLLQDKVVVISKEATIIEEKHREKEASDDLVSRVGSTGKGIGASRADRIMRTANRVADFPELANRLRKIKGCTVDYVGARGWNSLVNGGDPVIIEGTQGYALGLHAGYYPKCTSSDCRAIDFMAMAGVNPWHFSRDKTTVWVVSRIYPIRVAGNSGPMVDETTWEELGLPEERTTVTNKVRRVGGVDIDLINQAVRNNGGPGVVKIALTMVDHLDSSVWGVTEVDGLTHKVKYFVSDLSVSTGADVGLVCTSPSTSVWMDKEKHSVGSRRVQQSLGDWWSETSSSDAEKVVPKAVEYGSEDLSDIGEVLHSLMGKDPGAPQEQTETGIFFYLVGKMARWSNAIKKGRKVSDDTLLDITTYSMMARRNRDVGGWPYADDTEEV